LFSGNEEEELMPIYEYHCDACGTTFEEWTRRADDATEQPCPQCARTAHRLISHTSFVLKGGGWYVTEYGNRKSEPSADGAPAEAAGKPPAPDGGAPAPGAPATAPAAKDATAAASKDAPAAVSAAAPKAAPAAAPAA
jgi:putative FmdB family regulatory protein